MPYAYSLYRVSWRGSQQDVTDAPQVYVHSDMRSGWGNTHSKEVYACLFPLWIAPKNR
jgi:hypothetical protein